MHVLVDHVSELAAQRGELVEVRGEERIAAQVLDDILRDGPRDAEAVKGAGATT